MLARVPPQACNTRPPLFQVVASRGVAWWGQVSLVCCGHVGIIGMSVHLSASQCGQQESCWEELCETGDMMFGI